MPGYLRKHIRGQLPLGVSFWVNFVALSALVYLAGAVIRGAASPDARVVFVVALAWFLAFHLGLYAWQVLGTWRAAERAMLDYRPGLWVRGVQITVLLSVFGVLSQALEVVHLGSARRAPAPPPAADPSYALALSPDAIVVHLQGAIDFGLTRDLAALLEARPDIAAIDFDSGGGRVAEARGVARLIERHGLDTHVETHCHSACALAYLGGVTRTLGPRARLGFHAYRLDSPYLPMFMDVGAEMERDLAALAARGIAPGFLDRVSRTPPSAMWFPSLDELLAAGVAHGVRAEAAPVGPVTRVRGGP